VLGSWQYEGGGGFHSNNDIFAIDRSAIVGSHLVDPSIRVLDQSEIGRVLTGDARALRNGPPVTAMLIQNTNPVNVAPEQRLVKQGFQRQDLFVAVHEHFMTDTAKLADIVLPATMFVEHDDIYRGGGQSHLLIGPKLVEPPSTVRTNLFVIQELAKRLGVLDQADLALSERAVIDKVLIASGKPDFATLEQDKWLDCQPDFDTAHFVHGFGFPDGKFRFKPDWTGTKAPSKPPLSIGNLGPWQALPDYPDHCDLTEQADDQHPFRLATSPARQFLNSSFTETKTSLEKEGRPEVMIHADDAAALGIESGDIVTIGNERGQIRLHARITDRVKPGVLIAEGLWPNSAHLDGEGINVLTGADNIAPYGGAAFHDNRVWVKAPQGNGV
jgi:anaerobic selenocysteine-containing dehydrogenase